MRGSPASCCHTVPRHVAVLFPQHKYPPSCVAHFWATQASQVSFHVHKFQTYLGNYSFVNPEGRVVSVGRWDRIQPGVGRSGNPCMCHPTQVCLQQLCQSGSTFRMQFGLNWRKSKHWVCGCHSPSWNSQRDLYPSGTAACGHLCCRCRFCSGVAQVAAQSARVVGMAAGSWHWRGGSIQLFG